MQGIWRYSRYGNQLVVTMLDFPYQAILRRYLSQMHLKTEIFDI
jgi:hypothetical protein